jgi:hypothetical protein
MRKFEKGRKRVFLKMRYVVAAAKEHQSGHEQGERGRVRGQTGKGEAY